MDRRDCANPGAGSTYYYGVAALPNGAWAVGTGQETGALTAFYPGACLTPTPTACPITRQTVPSPDVPGAENDLHAVAGAAPDDVWAVGAVPYPTPDTLLLHWDGTQWSIVPGAGLPPGGGELDGAAALAPDDVWAVGSYSAGALTEHWDGTQWRLVPAPGGGQLYAVAGVAADDVWAVGFGGDGLIEHWNGLAWSVVPGPSVTGYYGVSALAADNAWAVGPSGTVHWDGQAWTLVPDALDRHDPAQRDDARPGGRVGGRLPLGRAL